MSGGTPDDPLSPSQFRRLDQVCNRFEACWKAGGRPEIEEYLHAAREEHGAELLRELLLLDIEYRAASGQDPSAAQYKARFPQYAGLIDDVFRQMPPRRAASTDHADEPGPQIVLEVVGGPHKGRRFDFAGHDNFIVGRARSTHFRLPREDPYFSRFHFMVEINPPRCRLVDLVSLNGTFVNGRRVEVIDLHDGDEIKGGDTVLRVSLVGLGGTVPEKVPPAAGRPRVDTTGAPRPAGADLSCGAKAPPQVVAAGQPPPEREPSVQAPVIPGFEIVGEVGRGGMGVVYLVNRTADAARLALKTIRPADPLRGCPASEREVQRFLRECQILCTLRHPHIVGFHQMGRAGDLFYFVMDYVRGTDAGRLVERHGVLPVARAVRLVCQILEALDYAHGRGFVHRDVKPANLLISREHDQEACRLADFGLARVYHDSRMSGLTIIGEMGGTLPYMPPEQITNYRDARPSGDQYSAAATLYYLLTGSYAYDFDEDRPQQQLMKILTERPLPIRSRRPEIPDRLASVIHQALAKDPGKRFADAEAFREALLPFGNPS